MRFAFYLTTNYHDCLITGIISENEFASIRVIIRAGKALKEMPKNMDLWKTA